MQVCVLVSGQAGVRTSALRSGVILHMVKASVIDAATRAVKLRGIRASFTRFVAPEADKVPVIGGVVNIVFRSLAARSTNALTCVQPLLEIFVAWLA